MVKNTEAQLILKNIPKEQVGALHELKNSAAIFEHFKKLLNDMLNLDEGKIISLAGTMEGVDDAVKMSSKQNFYKGRINMIVLIHALIINAEKEMEIRERKSK
jgi:hypothetical protein